MTETLAGRAFEVPNKTFRNSKMRSAADIAADTGEQIDLMLSIEAARTGGNRERAADKLGWKYGICPTELLNWSRPSKRPKRAPYDLVENVRSAWIATLTSWQKWCAEELKRQARVTPGAELKTIANDLRAIETTLRSMRGE